MESFKFKKPVIILEKDVLEEFNSKFSEIESDTFLTNQYGSEPDEVYSLTSINVEDISTLEMIARLDRDRAMKEKGKFGGEEYDNKIDKYIEFMGWVKKNQDSSTVVAKVYCPYTHELINNIYFPSIYSMTKIGYAIHNNSYYYGGRRYVYKLKVKDVFKIKFKNDPLEYMSRRAKAMFFAYWSYDMLDTVTLNQAKDANLLKATENEGTLYYGNSNEIWGNQLYYGPKGFYVKMKSKRIYFPCPSYESLQENLVLLDRGEAPNLHSHNLPTHDERVRQAIAFGVVDASLAPKGDVDKEPIVQKIKTLVNSGDSSEKVYDEIKLIMESEKGE